MTDDENGHTTDDLKELIDVENGYTTDDIDVLGSLEAIRNRPEMYVGAGEEGVHNVVEAVASDHLACLASDAVEDLQLDIVLEGGGVTVEYVGSPLWGDPMLALTALHSGPLGREKSSEVLERFSDSWRYGICGAVVANALSRELVLELVESGEETVLRFEHGELVEHTSERETEPDHSILNFVLDPAFFEEAEVDFEAVCGRMEGLIGGSDEPRLEVVDISTGRVARFPR